MVMSGLVDDHVHAVDVQWGIIRLHIPVDRDAGAAATRDCRVRQENP